MELLGFKLFLCSVLIDTARQFAKEFVSIYMPTATGESSSCSISLPALGGVLSFHLAICVRVCVCVCNFLAVFFGKVIFQVFSAVFLIDL